MLARCRATVFSLITRAAAISRLVAPPARQRRTSASRAVSPFGADGREAASVRRSAAAPSAVNVAVASSSLPLGGLAVAEFAVGGREEHADAGGLVRRVQLLPARGRPRAARTGPPAPGPRRAAPRRSACRAAAPRAGLSNVVAVSVSSSLALRAVARSSAARAISTCAAQSARAVSGLSGSRAEGGPDLGGGDRRAALCQPQQREPGLGVAAETVRGRGRPARRRCPRRAAGGSRR